MDLRLLSKDHAVTVAVCDDTLTEIRYTTLKDTTEFRCGQNVGKSIRPNNTGPTTQAQQPKLHLAPELRGFCPEHSVPPQGFEP